jgi:uncharacterized membrane protein
MSDPEENDRQWSNPDNWSGPGLVSFYFSKRDTRTWVPKKIPWMGWTLNLGKPAGAAWLLGFIIGLPLLPVLAFLSLASCLPK